MMIVIVFDSPTAYKSLILLQEATLDREIGSSFFDEEVKPI
jgi:hypothetical protein